MRSGPHLDLEFPKPDCWDSSVGIYQSGMVDNVNSGFINIIVKKATPNRPKEQILTNHLAPLDHFAEA